MIFITKAIFAILNQPNNTMKVWKKLAIIFSIGIVMTVFGLTMGILWSTIYSSILSAQLSVTPTSTNHKLWKETPIPMFLKLYMFNLSNPEDFTSSEFKSKPKFTEMGPYVFREVDYKVGETWNNNDTITYQRKRVWHFDQSLSTGSLSDKITNINPVTASVAYAVRYEPPIIRSVVDEIMKIIKQKLIITKTVNELLFEGFDDAILKLARKINMTKIPFDRFAWFYERNNSNSYDGTFNMYTGKDNLLDLGVLTEWNYDSAVGSYAGECGKVTGTNGDLWPPLPDNKTVTFFVTDICTSLTATYNHTTVHEGLTGFTYIGDETILDNGTLVPSRQCYCENQECIPSGALNISACKWGAPAFISLPHFYLADSSYRENIEGMQPNKEKHELQISIEPKTGVPLNVNAKLQLNLLLEQDKHMAMFKNIQTTFIPMLWFAQQAYLTSDYASTVKLIIILESLGSITFYGIASIGTLIVSIGVFLYIRHSLRGDDNVVLLPESNSETAVN